MFDHYLIKKSIASAIGNALSERGILGSFNGDEIPTKIYQLPTLNVLYHTEIPYDEEKATQIVSVAQSYLDAIADGRLVIVYKAGYSTLSGQNQRLKNDDGIYIIQCSAFCGLILRGIAYEDSPFFDGDGSKVNARTDLFPWANTDYETGGFTEANQLAQYAMQTGCMLNSADISEAKKGDILFWAKSNGKRFADIWHVGIAMEDGATKCVHALNGYNTAIWTFDMTNNPPAILGELKYIARPRYNIDFSKANEIIELKILEQPQDYTGIAGDTARFTVVAQGEGLTYQWQYCKANNINWYNSAADGCDTDTQLIVVASYRNGDKYRCIVTDKYGNSVISDIAVIHCTS